MRILVADDEKIKRVTLAHDLAAQGHEVVTAGRRRRSAGEAPAPTVSTSSSPT